MQVRPRSQGRWKKLSSIAELIILFTVTRFFTSRKDKDLFLVQNMQIYYTTIPRRGRLIVVDIYRDVKRRGIYPPLFTDPEGDSCFSIYQIRWIKKCCFKFFFWNFRETTRHFSLRTQNSECPRIFRVKGANQNARKLLSTDLVNTNYYYYYESL